MQQQEPSMQQQEPRGTSSEQPVIGTKPEEGYQKALKDAVVSLYEDGILPQADVLRRRLEEQGESWSDWGNSRIREVCTTAGLILREARPKAGISYSVLLPESQQSLALLTEEEVDRSNFETEWAALANYLQTEVWFGPERHLTSNYALARQLKKTPESGVDRLRLGVIVGLIRQLLELRVIGHHREGGGTRLVRFEDSWEQEQLTRYQTAEGVVRDWGELRRNLRQLLSDVEGNEGIFMSLLKHQYKRQFNQTLHEAAFNELKLEKLLSDPRLADICEVRKEGTEARVVLVTAGTPVPLLAAMPTPSVVNTFLHYTGQDMVEQDCDGLLAAPPRRSRSASPATARHSDCWAVGGWREPGKVTGPLES